MSASSIHWSITTFPDKDYISVEISFPTNIFVKILRADLGQFMEEAFQVIEGPGDRPFSLMIEDLKSKFHKRQYEHEYRKNAA